MMTNEEFQTWVVHKFAHLVQRMDKLEEQTASAGARRARTRPRIERKKVGT